MTVLCGHCRIARYERASVVCGLACTALGLALEWQTWPGLRVAWWAVVYGGIVSVGIGYTLQMIGQRGAPATDAVLVLSLEGVFAALFGWWFLGELLTPRQLAGCGRILGGMLLVQLVPGKSHKPPRAHRGRNKDE